MAIEPDDRVAARLDSGAGRRLVPGDDTVPDDAGAQIELRQPFGHLARTQSTQIGHPATGRDGPGRAGGRRFRGPPVT